MSDKAVESIVKEFQLSEAQAREIISEQTRLALIKSKLAWLLLAIGFCISGYLYFQPGTPKITAIFVLIFFVVAWQMVGRHFASESIRNAAMEKRQNIDRWNS